MSDSLVNQELLSPLEGLRFEKIILLADCNVGPSRIIFCRSHCSVSWNRINCWVTGPFCGVGNIHLTHHRNAHLRGWRQRVSDEQQHD
jgi:hypothetical protein